MSRPQQADLAGADYDPLSPPLPPRGSAAATVWRFAGWMASLDAPRTAVLLAVELLGGLLLAATVWVARYAFEDAVGVFRGTVPLGALLGWVGTWALLTLLHQAAWPVVNVVVERVRQEMEDSLQLRLQRKAAALRLEVFERADFYDVLSRARETTRPGFFLNVLLSFLSVPGAVATITAMAAVVGRWSPWLLAATIVAALPDPLARILQSRATFFLERKQTLRQRLRGYLAGVLTSRTEAKEVRTFGLAPWLIGRWRDLYWSVADESFAQERAQSLAGAGTSALGAIGLAGGLGFAAWGLLAGHLQAGQFAAMLLALQAVQQAMDQVTHALGQYVGGMVLKLADLFVYLDLGPEESSGTEPPAGAGTGDITLEGVSFRYPQRPEPALRDIRCALREGERVALVGENGAGKTTLVKVLTGLYRPTEGRVLYGGRDLAELDLRALRDRQAAVFQDHVHYAFTLSDNVGYGRAEHRDDRSAVEAAAARGGADAVAAALPQGYDTLLTRQFSGGTDLSGGQWQRVAVSRGFMRDAPLVVLDEPTAALDPRAEADVFRRFAAMAGGRTALLVSHRLGFARLCDRVLVLGNGRLIEQGTHDDLVAAGGVYARMWATQAQWYR